MTNTPHLWLATCRSQPALWFDDEALPQALAAEGIRAEPRAWQDIPADAPALVRTPWDYAEHLDEFRAWLAGRTGPTINPAERMLWNLDKRYLLELAAAGHAIVPTKVLPAFDAAAVETIRRAQRWDAAIAKPVVGCAAEGLTRVRGEHVETFDQAGNTWSERKAATPEGPCLVQPFLPAIDAGEWSLFYFGGRFSHAVLKTPAEGDIRVQEEHGGRTRSGDPPAVARVAADAIAAEVPDCTYARVDGLMDASGDGDRFLLMELELIEPELYFRYAPGTEANLAKAVAQRLASQ